jgi:hypothetical protein
MKRRQLLACLAGLALLAPGELAARPRAGDIDVTAGGYRYLAAASPSALLAELPASSRPAMEAVFRPGGDRMGDPYWAELMAGAVQRVEAAGQDEARTLWFNPVLDAGLAIRWRRVSGVWAAVEVAPVLGEVLREAAFDPVRDYTRTTWQTSGGAPVAAALAISNDISAHATIPWNNLFDAGDGSRLAVLIRCITADRSLREVQAAPGYAGSLALLRRLLVLSDPQSAHLPPGLARALAAMGDNGRLTLGPTAAFRRPDGYTLAMQSPDAPGVVLFAHFTDPPAGGVALPTRFEAVEIIHWTGA